MVNLNTNTNTNTSQNANLNTNTNTNTGQNLNTNTKYCLCLVSWVASAIDSVTKAVMLSSRAAMMPAWRVRRGDAWAF